MQNIHEFDCHIYPRKIWISIGASLEELNEFFEIPYDELPDSSYADVTNNRRLKPNVAAGILIRFHKKSDMTVENIAHESLHAALEVFDYVGAIIDTKNQEPFAYLCGYIAKCINLVKTGKHE